jgi:hypothetical protein
MGSVLAPLVGTYPSFVMINVAFWSAGALATYALAVRHTRSPWTGILAAVLVSTAPAFEALAGQALPYVVSYSCFVLGLLLFDRLRVFERATSATLAAGSGVVAGLSLLFYDVYMLPAFVLVYGLMRRMPLRNLALMLIAMAVPRVAWTGYWQLAHLPSYSHNEQHPAEALLAWIDTARMGIGPAMLKSYLALAAHGVLNIGAAFLFWPVALAAWELWQRRGSTEARWCVAVLVAGFAPALFMLSTWPHIPRWYEYGFPAVYILAAAAGERLGRRVHVRPAVSARGSTSSPRTEKRRAQIAVAVLIVLPAVVLANLDVLGYTKPMELVLFQPTHWSYLWSR